jgi:hypothetical protein
MSTADLTRTTILSLSIFLLAAWGAHAGEVYRWKDEEGKVHFTATLPPEYANKPYQVISESGLVIREVDPMAVETAEAAEDKAEAKQTDPQWTEEMVQLRADRLLVLKYHSEEEIIEAMNVEIGNLGYDARIIQQTQASVLNSMTNQIREAADRQRAGMPKDPETAQMINQLQARLQQGVRASTALLAREESIRAMFMAELERYRYLVSQGLEDRSF